MPGAPPTYAEVTGGVDDELSSVTTEPSVVQQISDRMSAMASDITKQFSTKADDKDLKPVNPDDLFHFIDGAGDQQAPVPASLLKQWLAQGYVSEATFVWADDGSMETWATLLEAEALYAFCLEGDPPPIVAEVSVLPASAPTPGQPPVFFIHDADVKAEKKYEKKRRTAVVVSCCTAVALFLFSAATVYYGAAFLDNSWVPQLLLDYNVTAQEADLCLQEESLLLRVVYAWLCGFSLLLLAAELSLPAVRTYLHILAYRSGRVALSLFCLTILLADVVCFPPAEPPPTADANGDGMVSYEEFQAFEAHPWSPSAPPPPAIHPFSFDELFETIEKRVQWKGFSVATLVVISAFFNLVVAKRARKVGRSRNKAKPAKPTDRDARALF
jgi:hypothetical protein